MKVIETQDFWSWAFSDLMSNSLRGILAEYIVASALHCTNHTRAEWDAYDLKTSGGIKIEVKSSAYLQTWKQKKHSTIRFDIAHKKSWHAETNISLKESARSADIYVFCVFSSLEKLSANPLDTTQWFFLVCSSDFLNQEFNEQKTVGLASLEQKGLQRVSFIQLENEVAKWKI